MSRVWMITGAGRGLGRAFAAEAVKQGDQVIAAVRKIPEDDVFFQDEAVLPVILDVTNEEQISGAVAAGVKRFGRIDVLVNNAGFGMAGALEEVSDAELRFLFDADFFGMVNVIKAVLPVMREQKSGRILNISSLGGLVGGGGATSYSAAKFAVVGMSEGLRAELAPFGIQVSAVCPGSFRTDFRDGSSLKLPAESIDAYDGTPAHAAGAWLSENNHKQQGDPERAAAFVYKMAVSETLPGILTVGRDSCDGYLKHMEEIRNEIESYYEEAVQTDYTE